MYVYHSLLRSRGGDTKLYLIFRRAPVTRLVCMGIPCVHYTLSPITVRASFLKVTKGRHAPGGGYNRAQAISHHVIKLQYRTELTKRN